MSQIYNEKFYQAQKNESYQSAKVLLEIFKEQVFSPKSVVDIGCGIGTWLRPWQEISKNGIEILGIDDNEMDEKSFFIDKKYYHKTNLTKPAKEILKEIFKKQKPRKFDLVQSLEVGEHFSEEFAPNFIDLLTNLGDLVLFSAAIPYQGGTHHVNCREPGYWANLFKERGFDCFDILRAGLWDVKNIAYYYRQNIMLYARGDSIKALQERGFKKCAKPSYLIHYDMWKLRNDEFMRIYQQLLLARAQIIELKALSGGKII